jgi:hypothetical protein
MNKKNKDKKNKRGTGKTPSPSSGGTGPTSKNGNDITKIHGVSSSAAISAVDATDSALTTVSVVDVKCIDCKLGSRCCTNTHTHLGKGSKGAAARIANKTPKPEEVIPSEPKQKFPRYKVCVFDLAECKDAKCHAHVVPVTKVELIEGAARRLMENNVTDKFLIKLHGSVKVICDLLDSPLTHADRMQIMNLNSWCLLTDGAGISLGDEEEFESVQSPTKAIEIKTVEAVGLTKTSASELTAVKVTAEVVEMMAVADIVEEPNFPKPISIEMKRASVGSSENENKFDEVVDEDDIESSSDEEEDDFEEIPIELDGPPPAWEEGYKSDSDGESDDVDEDCDEGEFETVVEKHDVMKVYIFTENGVTPFVSAVPDPDSTPFLKRFIKLMLLYAFLIFTGLFFLQLCEDSGCSSDFMDTLILFTGGFFLAFVLTPTFVWRKIATLTGLLQHRGGATPINSPGNFVMSEQSLHARKHVDSLEWWFTSLNKLPDVAQFDVYHVFSEVYSHADEVLIYKQLAEDILADSHLFGILLLDKEGATVRSTTRLYVKSKIEAHPNYRFFANNFIRLTNTHHFIINQILVRGLADRSSDPGNTPIAASIGTFLGKRLATASELDIHFRPGERSKTVSRNVPLSKSGFVTLPTSKSATILIIVLFVLFVAQNFL